MDTCKAAFLLKFYCKFQLPDFFYLLIILSSYAFFVKRNDNLHIDYSIYFIILVVEDEAVVAVGAESETALSPVEAEKPLAPSKYEVRPDLGEK